MAALARQQVQRQVEQPQRLIKTKPQKLRKSFFSFRELVVIGLCSVAFLFAVSSIIQTQSNVFSVNSENVSLQNQIEEQKKMNKDLSDQVRELSMPETVIAKANQLGLSLNDNNVKVVR
ncbi:MAG: ftsL [Bacillales bacterium]|jgi:cell division protein FtsL|nr:ftsL [Bacillales bacterium]